MVKKGIKSGIGLFCMLCFLLSSIQGVPLWAGETGTAEVLVDLDLLPVAEPLKQFEGYTLEMGEVRFLQGADTTRYRITGQSTGHSLVVPGGLQAELLLDEVTMDLVCRSAIRVEPGASLALGLTGASSLRYSERLSGNRDGESYACVAVPEGASLAIFDADGTGSLYVESGSVYLQSGSAGIGGDAGRGAGAISLESGRVQVYTCGLGAALGGGGYIEHLGGGVGHGGSVTVLGGHLEARAYQAAAIGAGGAKSETPPSLVQDGGEISLLGGEVTALSSEGAALGGGPVRLAAAESVDGRPGRITVAGNAKVTAVSSLRAAISGPVLYTGMGTGTLVPDATQPVLHLGPDASLTCFGYVTGSGFAVNAGTVTGEGSLANLLLDTPLPDPTHTATTTIALFDGRGQGKGEIELPYVEGYEDYLFQLYDCNAVAYTTGPEALLHRVYHGGAPVGLLAAPGLAEGVALTLAPDAAGTRVTLADLPVVFTPWVGSVTQNGAVLVSEGHDLGTAPFAAAGIEVAASADFGQPNAFPWHEWQAGRVETRLEPLGANQELYFRAYLTNSNGAAYSEPGLLRTLPDAGEIDWEIKVEGDVLSVQGSLPQGSVPLTSLALHYSRDEGFESYETLPIGLPQAGQYDFSARIEGLAAGAWYARLNASNKTGEGLGGEACSEPRTFAAGLVLTVDYLDRQGKTIKARENLLLGAGDWYTVAPPSLPGYAFSGWTLDGVAGSGNGFAMPGQSATLVLVYGTDTTGDGREDFPVRIRYLDAEGAALKPEESKQVKVGDSPPAPAAITGHSFIGYRVNDGGLVAAAPSFTVETGHYGLVLDYVYTPDVHTLTAHFQDRQAVALAQSQPHEVRWGQAFTVPVPAIEGYVPVGWLENGRITEGALPAQTIRGDVDVTLVYGLDKNGNGIEDMRLEERHLDLGGVELAPPAARYIDRGGAYSGAANAGLIEAGYRYAGYAWQGGSFVEAPAQPSLASVQEDANVTYYYALRRYAVTEAYQTKYGDTLAPSGQAEVQHGGTFTGAYPDFPGWTPAYCLVQGVQVGGAAPTLDNLTHPVELVYVYGLDADGDGVEDFLVEERFLSPEGEALAPARVVHVRLGETYTPALPDLGILWRYDGYRLPGEMELRPGLPAPTFVPGAADVAFELVFAPQLPSHGVALTHVMADGTPVEDGARDTRQTVAHGEAWACQPPEIENLEYIGWRLDGAEMGGDTPEIDPVNTDHSVQLVYDNVAPPSDSGEQPDDSGQASSQSPSALPSGTQENASSGNTKGQGSQNHASEATESSPAAKSQAEGVTATGDGSPANLLLVLLAVCLPLLPILLALKHRERRGMR